MYIQDLALINQQWLICHKTKPNKLSKFIILSFCRDCKRIALCHSMSYCYILTLD